MSAGRRKGETTIKEVEDLFYKEDDSFLDALRNCDDQVGLGKFVDRWRRARGKWPRQQIVRYLDMPLNCFGHQVVVKRLFKEAEEMGDHELLASFMVAFDRLVRRERIVRHRYNWETRETTVTQSLVLLQNRMPYSKTYTATDYFGRKQTFSSYISASHRLFSNRTRWHLRRRAWRNLRQLGHKDSRKYTDVVSAALKQYHDDDLVTGEDILECWGMMNACYKNSDTVEFTSTNVRVRQGKRVGDLQAAPYFPHAWEASHAGELLLDLVANARSRMIRIWAIQLIREHHFSACQKLDVSVLATFFESVDPSVQAFASELLEVSELLPALPIQRWLELVNSPHPLSQVAFCNAMKQHVTAQKIRFEDAIALAKSSSIAAAELGIHFLEQISTPSHQRNLVAEIAETKCAALAERSARWALQHYHSKDEYNRDEVTAFFDSLLSGTRRAALNWLQQDECPAQDDPVLWCRLTESPYEDIRLKLVHFLQTKADATGLSTDDMTPVWSSVLLGVHRGGRTKLAAVKQLANAINKKPKAANSLLPVLAIAVRSIRRPEFRAGLAAIVQLVENNEVMAETVVRLLPELQLTAGASQ